MGRPLPRGVVIRLLFAATIVALAAAVGGSPNRPAGAAGACGSARPSLDSEELAAVALVNGYRAERGLSPLRVSPVLSGIGAWMLDDVAGSGRVEHVDSLGRSAYARSVACGYSSGAGENLAAGRGWDTAAAALEAWKVSPVHDANLLGRYYTEIGIARLQRAGSIYGWYWALEFGAASLPASPPAAASTSRDFDRPVNENAEGLAAESRPNPVRPWRVFVVNY